MILTYVVQIYESIFPIKKKWCKQYKYSMYRLTQKFSDTLRSMGVKILKRNLTHLCCTKSNEINICHSDAQKNIFPIENGVDER